LHGIAKNIAGGTLDDVLYKLGAIAFQPFPFLRTAYTHVSHRLPAKLVLSDPRFHIGKPPAGRKRDKEHSTPVIKMEPVCLRGDSLPDTVLHCPVYIPPETDDIGICLSPAVHQGLQFLLRHSCLQCTHCFQRTDASAVPAG